MRMFLAAFFATASLACQSSAFSDDSGILVGSALTAAKIAKEVLAIEKVAYAAANLQTPSLEKALKYLGEAEDKYGLVLAAPEVSDSAIWIAIAAHCVMIKKAEIPILTDSKWLEHRANGDYGNSEEEKKDAATKLIFVQQRLFELDTLQTLLRCPWSAL